MTDWQEKAVIGKAEHKEAFNHELQPKLNTILTFCRIQYSTEEEILYLHCIYFPPSNCIISDDSPPKQKSEKNQPYSNVFQLHLTIKRSF